jgi:hypothetical protein
LRARAFASPVVVAQASIALVTGCPACIFIRGGRAWRTRASAAFRAFGGAHRSRRGSPTPARRVGRTSALICSRRSWPLPRQAARPRPRRRRGHPGRRRDRHGGPAAPGLPRRRAGPAPAVRAAAHAATARSLAACAAIPAWVPLRPGGPASSPGYSAPAASLALMVPAPACSQRAEVRRPVSSPPCERARYLCTRRNTHWRYPGLAGDRRRAFSIVLVGNQIDAPMFVKAFFSSFWKSARSGFC